MAKIRQLVFLALQRPFLIRLAGIFAAIIGVASGALGIAGWHMEIASATAFIAFALLIAAVIACREMINPILSVDDLLDRDIDDRITYRVHCPCNLNLSNQAKALARTFFHGETTIKPEVYEQLRAKNPYILACLTDENGSLLGYFDAMPLKETFARAFIDGLVTEEQITHEDILGPQEVAACKYLYLSGIAAKNPANFVGRKSSSMLLWAFSKYLQHFYGQAQPIAFAIAVTRDGDALLARLKLHLQASAATRPDGYNLYSVVLSKDEIDRRLTHLRDWSGECILDWGRDDIIGLEAKRAIRRTRTRVATGRDVAPARVIR